MNKKDTIIIEKQIPMEVQKERKHDNRRINDTDRINSADVFAQKYRGGVSVKYLMAQSDSLLKDSTFKPTAVLDEEINVRKDEMIAMRTISVMNINEDTDKSTTDSLLQTVSGIRDDSKNALVSFKVEFWQSPVNYRGYKMGKNKIVLFGMKEDDDVQLYKIKDEIYLRQNENFYRMDYINEFRAFEKVNDRNVLVKLK